MTFMNAGGVKQNYNALGKASFVGVPHSSLQENTKALIVAAQI